MQYVILALLLCGVFFILPMQVYIIGNDNGIGIQGATYRYQISGYGNSLIPVTNDVMYVVNGIYSGKTALSIMVWALGTVLLACTTLLALINTVHVRPNSFSRIAFGLLLACCCYVISCIAQYGWFLSGPAGHSMPVGILLVVFWIFIVYKYREIFLKSS